MSKQPNPVFPVEVFVIIAGFAAGDNDYAGVAAMCGTSHLMNTEITPVLYETLFWNDRLHTQLRNLLHGSADESIALKFRHTRYVARTAFFTD
jgi:hypothetical protein